MPVCTTIVSFAVSYRIGPAFSAGTRKRLNAVLGGAGSSASSGDPVDPLTLMIFARSDLEAEFFLKSAGHRSANAVTLMPTSA